MTNAATPQNTYREQRRNMSEMTAVICRFHSTVNRAAVGSNPTQGATFSRRKAGLLPKTKRPAPSHYDKHYYTHYDIRGLFRPADAPSRISSAIVPAYPQGRAA